jgi:hypothetical protein
VSPFAALLMAACTAAAEQSLAAMVAATAGFTNVRSANATTALTPESLNIEYSSYRIEG